MWLVRSSRALGTFKLHWPACETSRAALHHALGSHGSVLPALRDLAFCLPCLVRECAGWTRHQGALLCFRNLPDRGDHATRLTGLGLVLPGRTFFGAGRPRHVVVVAARDGHASVRRGFATNRSLCKQKQKHTQRAKQVCASRGTTPHKLPHFINLHRFFVGTYPAGTSRHAGCPTSGWYFPFGHAV